MRLKPNVVFVNRNSQDKSGKQLRQMTQFPTSQRRRFLLWPIVHNKLLRNLWQIYHTFQSRPERPRSSS